MQDEKVIMPSELTAGRVDKELILDRMKGWVSDYPTLQRFYATLAEVIAEPVPESAAVAWRDLEIGEKIRVGDRCMSSVGVWVTNTGDNLAVGMALHRAHLPHQRRVSIDGNRGAHFKAIYIACNRLLGIVGAEGHVESDSGPVEDLLSALKDFDGGNGDEDRMFGGES